MPVSVTFRDRLISAETDFYSALLGSDDSIVAFNTRWETLLDEIHDASESLDADTLTLAHTTASRIAALADTSIELYSSYDKFTSELVDQLDSMMSELTLTDIVPTNITPYSLPSPPSPSLTTKQQVTPQFTRKRRRVPEITEQSVVSPRPVKKQRYAWSSMLLCWHSLDHSVSNLSYSVKNCPSKQPLTHHSPQHVAQLAHAEARSATSQSPVYRSRKRRLSEGDVTPQCRPTKVRVGPRLHAVSNPYPSYPLHAPTITRDDVFYEASSLAECPVVTAGPHSPLDISSLPLTEDCLSNDIGTLFGLLMIEILVFTRNSHTTVPLEDGMLSAFVPVSGDATSLPCLDSLDDILRSFFDPTSSAPILTHTDAESGLPLLGSPISSASTPPPLTPVDQGFPLTHSLPASTAKLDCDSDLAASHLAPLDADSFVGLFTDTDNVDYGLFSPPLTATTGISQSIDWNTLFKMPVLPSWSMTQLPYPSLSSSDSSDSDSDYVTCVH